MTRIALAQTWVEEPGEPAVQAGLRLVQEAAARGVRAICFPELSFLPFFPQQRADPRLFDLAESIPGPTVLRFQEAAAGWGLVVLINLFERAGAGEYYDTTVVIDGDGRLVGTTRMTHIAEFEDCNEKYYYRPGNSGTPVHGTQIGRVGVAICYDRWFPELMRALAIQGAELVFVPTASFGALGRRRWTIESRASALVNGYFIAVVNRTGKDGNVEFFGQSYVAGPDGEILSMAGDGSELRVVEVDLEQIEVNRRLRGFLRDRRPETYGVLTCP